MAKNKKKIIWHKKSGKLLPSSALKVHGAVPHAIETANTGNSAEERRKVFAKKLSIQIKKAVRGEI